MQIDPEVADALDVQRCLRWLCISLLLAVVWLSLFMAIRASIGDDARMVRTVTAGEPAKVPAPPRITPLIGERP